MHPRSATLVTVNDVRHPRTGGDEVYRSIHRVLLGRYGRVTVHTLAGGGGAAAKALRYLRCLASSAARRRGDIVFTSASPTFPVFGHATYHQPKGGMFSRHSEGGPAGRRLACALTGHEALSPLWLLAKGGMPLHLSNSEYTRRLVRRLYCVESRVLYPAVKPPEAPPAEKRRMILVTKPEKISGVEELPRALHRPPAGATVVVIGRIDDAGRRALRELKRLGVRHEYLGYLPERRKNEVMAEASVHLNLVVNESFGLSTVEAMSHGAVPVAHRSGAPPEYLPPGLLYGDPEEAGEIAAQHIDAPAEAREEQRRIAAGFSEARFTGGLLRALRELEERLPDANP